MKVSTVDMILKVPGWADILIPAVVLFEVQTCNKQAGRVSTDFNSLGSAARMEMAQ